MRSGQQRDPKERAVSCRLLFARRLPAATGARVAVTNGRMQVAVVRDRRCRKHRCCSEMGSCQPPCFVVAKTLRRVLFWCTGKP